MTRRIVTEKLAWLVVAGGIAVGWTQGWNPVATAFAMLVVVAGLFWWSR